MKICTNCGKNMPDGAKFCGNCGADFKNTDAKTDTPRA
ncbi:MAG: zinc ribbon domain-containing protein [Christensenellaceae bacterium]|jgi:uncharacterized membrane protein YvbJ|nr:zinc ribbon domain-containing protein [Christensenellaceae bacterium]